MQDSDLPADTVAGQLIMDGAIARLNSLPTVAQLVAERPQRARVFEKYGISYCCGGGNKTVPEVCRQKNIDLAGIQAELARVDKQSANETRRQEPNWAVATPGELIAHMTTVHHAYLRAEMPRLSHLFDRVLKRHGDFFPELWELRDLFEEYRREMERHLDSEEVLFSTLRKFEIAPTDSPAMDVFRSRIQMLSRRNEYFRVSLSKMREWTQNFTPPQGACNTYRVLLQGLAELDAEVQYYLCDETVLFARALQEYGSRDALE